MRTPTYGHPHYEADEREDVEHEDEVDVHQNGNGRHPWKAGRQERERLPTQKDNTTI